MQTVEKIFIGLFKIVKFIFVWFILLPFSILLTLAYKKK